VLFVYLAVLWFALIVWTLRDARARTHNPLWQFLSVLLVFFFNLPGLVVYLILRPRETLADIYERALEEETLLQEIENPDLCPNCKRRIESEYILCPNCQVTLKEPCRYCARLMHPKWPVCPYCGKMAARGRMTEPPLPAAAHPPILVEEREPAPSRT
jgi:RNA polymerase subunit RPABC4/transcription elongation factor Spt4